MEIYNSIIDSSPYAIRAIAEIYNFEQFGKLNHQKAFEFYTLCVEKNFDSKEKALCTNYLAHMYKNGDYVLQNADKALELFTSSSKIYPEGFGSIGDIYYFEEYGMENPQKAFENYQLCAEKSSETERSRCKFNIASFYSRW